VVATPVFGLEVGLFVLEARVAAVFFEGEDFGNAHGVDEFAVGMVACGAGGEDPVAGFCDAADAGFAGAEGAVAEEWVWGRGCKRNE
jgi:hypothetical protein